MADAHLSHCLCTYMYMYMYMYVHKTACSSPLFPNLFSMKNAMENNLSCTRVIRMKLLLTQIELSNSYIAYMYIRYMYVHTYMYHILHIQQYYMYVLMSEEIQVLYTCKMYIHIHVYIIIYIHVHV